MCALLLLLLLLGSTCSVSLRESPGPLTHSLTHSEAQAQGQGQGHGHRDGTDIHGALAPGPASGVDWAGERGAIESSCLRGARLSSGHKAPRLQGNCSVYFVHNHKAGGTTLCNIAVQAGLRVAKPVRNCLEPDELRGAGKEGQLVRYMEQNSFQFVAHEFGPFLPLTQESKHIVYVTVVRNPWDRVLSAAHHELCQKNLHAAQEAAKVRHCHFNLSTATAVDVVLDPCFRRAFSSINHYVNKFSPCPTSRASGGQPECSVRQLQDAQQLLELMSVVLVTDSPETYAQSFVSLTAIAPQLRYEPSLRAGTTAHSNAKYLLRHNLTAWRTLVSLNEMDYQFYKHSLLLAERHLKRLAGAGRTVTFNVVDDQPYLPPPGSPMDDNQDTPFCTF